MTKESKDRQIEAVNPALGTSIGDVYLPKQIELEQLVGDLRVAAKIWHNRPKLQRNKALKTLQYELIHTVDEIATVINRQCGKSYQEGLLEVMAAADTLAQVVKMKGASPHGHGVTGIIAGTTFPFLLALRHSVAALGAGKCVVIVIDRHVPKIATLLQQIFIRIEALAPFVRVVVGDAQVVTELVAAGVVQWEIEPDAPLGSVIGQIVGRTNLAPTFAVGLVDDTDELPEIVRHAYWNAGQGSQRIRIVGVPEAQLEQAKLLLAKEMEGLTFGYSDQKKDLHHYGALQRVESAEKYAQWLASAQKAGATLLSGGTCDRQFVQPALLFTVDLALLDTRSMPQAPILILCAAAHLSASLEQLYQQHQALYLFAAAAQVPSLVKQLGRERLTNFNSSGKLTQMSMLDTADNLLTPMFSTDTLSFILKSVSVGLGGISLSGTKVGLIGLATTPGNYRALSAALKALYGAGVRQRLDSAEIIYNSYKVQQAIAQVNGRLQEIIDLGKQKLGKST